MEQNAIFSKSSSLSNSVFVSKLSKLIQACELSRNLMIGIYHIEENQFLYTNNKFKKITKSPRNKSVERSWDYWFLTIPQNEVIAIKRKLFAFFKASIHNNQMILKYPIVNADGVKVYIKHEIRLYYIDGQTIAINYFFDTSDQQRIMSCLQSNTKNPTNASQTISPREMQVLQLIGDGFSSKQIANQLFISNHTAISHRKHLIEKFQAKNTAQLIKKASQVIEL